MGVKPVEYVKDSSTQGFAVAGDEKVITKQNANTIQKDVDQGNTEDLDNAQERCLERYVDFDNIEYTEEENRNVGRNQIDTEGVEQTSGGNMAGTTTASLATSGGYLFAASIGKGLAKIGALPLVAMLVAAGMELVGAAMTIPATNAFDPEYKARTSQKDSADETNQIIQQYYDELTNNMDSMTADSEAYAAAAEKKFGESVALIDVIGEIDAQIIVYRAQGDEEKVAELMKQKEQYKKDAEVLNTDDPDGMGALKENIEFYASRNAEAQGVSESGAEVSEFLKQGSTLGILGTINSLFLLAAVAISATNAGKAIAKIKLPWDAPIAFAAAAIFVAIAACFAVSGTKMTLKTINEFKCADAGDQMAEYVASLNENIGAQAGFTEEIAAGYTAIDEAGAEVVTKTQEGVDKALQNQQQRLQNQPPENNSTGTPDNNPNPNSEPEQEEEPAA